MGFCVAAYAIRRGAAGKNVENGENRAYRTLRWPPVARIKGRGAAPTPRRRARALRRGVGAAPRPLILATGGQRRVRYARFSPFSTFFPAAPRRIAYAATQNPMRFGPTWTQIPIRPRAEFHARPRRVEYRIVLQPLTTQGEWAWAYILPN